MEGVGDVNGPDRSTGSTAAGWRDEILREFTPGVARLTVVDDPDGLFAEAGVVEALRTRGVEVVSLEDRVAFRFFYESRRRSRREGGDLADVVAVCAGGEAHGHGVPYDVWRAGRRVSFGLGGLFPRLSWPVVNALDRSDLDALYAAQAQEPPAGPLGESATRRFALRHVFGIAPETIRQASDLLRVLLRLHYRRLRPPSPRGARRTRWSRRTVLLHVYIDQRPKSSAGGSGRVRCAGRRTLSGPAWLSAGTDRTAEP